MTDVFVRVAIDQPMSVLFDYRYSLPADPIAGKLVLVPFGRREVVGLICEVLSTTDVPANKLRDVSKICEDCPPLSAQWIALASFAADYYQRGLGEVALPALPQ